MPFYRHPLDHGYSKHIEGVLKAPILTSGPVCKAVETKLCEFFEIEYTGLTNSWTNGALAALLALDIGSGDEVIIPAMTFVATSNVVELVGAKTVFVDVDPLTLLMSIDKMKEAVTPSTKAIIPVHLYGQMLDIKALREALGDRLDIAVIEDAAHCFEGNYAGQTPGRHSDVAVFSFYATKNVTCGEGGAFITNSAALYEKMLQTRCHGMTEGAAGRYRKGTYRHWDMPRLGVKANLSDLLAALLPPQIEAIHARLAVREAMAVRYEDAFRDTAIRLARVSPSARSARHLFAIHVPPAVRDQAIMALNERNVGVTVNYRSVPNMTYYQDKYGYDLLDFPNSYEWGAGTISLPLYPSLSVTNQEYVIDCVTEAVLPLIEQHEGGTARSTRRSKTQRT